MVYLSFPTFFNRFQHMKKLKTNELGRKSITEFKSATKHPVIVVLDNIRSLHNVGSVFRTADAFLLEALYLCGITGTPPNKEIYKTALGSSESVDWKYFETTESAIDLLKENEFRIVVVEQTDSTVSLTDYKFQNGQKVALVFGNEVNGVSDSVLKLCDDCIEIPQYGHKHSLNVSVAAGIVIWDITQKMRVSM